MKFRIVSILLFAGIGITGCSGGGGSSLPAVHGAPVTHTPTKPVVPVSAAKCPVKDKCIIIEIPPKKQAVHAKNLHRPAFISPSTVSTKIYIARATGTDANDPSMDTGTLLPGYPLTVALTRSSPNCETDATSGYLVCTIILTGIPTDGSSLGVNALLYDSSNNRLAISAISPYVDTLDSTGVPKDYATLTFSGSGTGGSNEALITMNGVVSSVGVVQDSMLFEGISGTSNIEFQGIDAAGNVIGSPGQYSDNFGNALRLAIFSGDFLNGNYPGHFNLSLSNCPPTVDSIEDLEPGCVNTLTYDGSIVQQPNQNLMENGSAEKGHVTTNVLEIQNEASFSIYGSYKAPGFNENFAEFAPIVFPAVAISGPTGVLSFANPSSASQTVATGIPASFGGGYGSQAYGQAGWLMDEQQPNYGGGNPPLSCSTVAGIENDVSSFTVSPQANGSCITTGLFNEGDAGGGYEPNTGSDVYNVGNRELESYPISVGNVPLATQAFQVTPSVVLSGGASSGSAFTLSQYGPGTHQISASEPWCASNAAVYPFVGIVAGKTSRNGPTNIAPASSLDTLGSTQATLVNSSSAQIQVIPNYSAAFGMGGICEVDVSIDGAQTTGSVYYTGQVFYAN